MSQSHPNHNCRRSPCQKKLKGILQTPMNLKSFPLAQGRPNQPISRRFQRAPKPPTFHPLDSRSHKDQGSIESSFLESEASVRWNGGSLAIWGNFRSEPSSRLEAQRHNNDIQTSQHGKTHTSFFQRGFRLKLLSILLKWITNCWYTESVLCGGATKFVGNFSCNDVACKCRYFQQKVIVKVDPFKSAWRCIGSGTSFPKCHYYNQIDLWPACLHVQTTIDTWHRGTSSAAKKPDDKAPFHLNKAPWKFPVVWLKSWYFMILQQSFTHKKPSVSNFQNVQAF